MKSIIVALSLLFVSNIASAQFQSEESTCRNSFELEAIFQSSKYTHYYGLGFSHKYALSRSFALRQSLRYLRADADYSKFGAGNRSFSSIGYNLDLVLALGKSKSWEVSLGGGHEWNISKPTNEGSHHSDSNFGIQLGIGKTFKVSGKERFKLGYMASYYNGELRNGIKLGILFP